MPKTTSIGDHRIALEKQASDKLASLKLAYQKKHGGNINIKAIVLKLVAKAKLSDIE